VAYASRYNGAGCDINRDFGEFQTLEAQAVRHVIEAYRPEVVVAPHEGRQDGFYLIATAAADGEVAAAVVRKLADAGVTLASRSFLGIELGTPGLSVEGSMLAATKRWIGLGSLGTYLDGLNVATYTTESSWGSDAFDERIRSHVLAIRAILEIAPRDVDVAP
jgi:hypothetical protein